MRALVIDGDLGKTAAHVKKHWRLYPLKEAASPREPHFVDLSGVQFNTIHANDVSFYEPICEQLPIAPSMCAAPGFWTRLNFYRE